MRSSKPSKLFAGLAVAVSLIAPPALAQQTNTFDPDSRKVVGDWVVECVKGQPQAPGACQLYQRVLTQQANTAALIAAVAWSPAENTLRLQAALPLGVELSSAPALKIDDAVVATFAWSRCLAKGCLVEAPISPELLGKLKTGQKAAFSIVIPGTGPIDIPVSLNGFAEGLASVEPNGSEAATSE